MLTAYLLSVAASWGVTHSVTKSYMRRLKREGYEVVKKEKSLKERAYDKLIASLGFIVPGYNVINSALVLWNLDEFYEEAKNDFLKEGSIIKKPTPVQTVSAKRPRIYEEMSTAEKLAWLEKEKSRVMNLSRTNNEQSFDNTIDKGPVLGRKKQ